jgi:hypothetical protein
MKYYSNWPAKHLDKIKKTTEIKILKVQFTRTFVVNADVDVLTRSK